MCSLYEMYASNKMQIHNESFTSIASERALQAPTSTLTATKMSAQKISSWPHLVLCVGVCVLCTLLTVHEMLNSDVWLNGNLVVWINFTFYLPQKIFSPFVRARWILLKSIGSLSSEKGNVWTHKRTTNQ